MLAVRGGWPAKGDSMGAKQSPGRRRDAGISAHGGGEIEHTLERDSNVGETAAGNHNSWEEYNRVLDRKREQIELLF